MSKMFYQELGMRNSYEVELVEDLSTQYLEEVRLRVVKVHGNGRPGQWRPQPGHVFKVLHRRNASQRCWRTFYE
jgi:hypothetical protein